MDQQPEQQEQQPEQQQQQEVPSKPIETVTKRETKVKNPKRVEQGKRLAEHNRKMKLQLAQMQQAESVEDSTNRNVMNTLDSRLLYAGGILLLGGLAFLVYKRFNNEPRTPEMQMSPVKPRPRPPTPPPQNLDMD